MTKYERFKNGVNLDVIIFPQNKFIGIWDWIVFVCLIFVVFVTPYQIGVTGGYDLYYSRVWFVINLMVSFVFLIDTCLFFFRPYRGSDGKYNITLPTIRKSYLKDMFIPNLLSSIPYALIFYLEGRETYNTYNDPLKDTETIHPGNTFILVLQLLTLLRLIRIHKTLKNHGPITDFKMRSNNQLTALFMNLCKLLIISHWFACIWCWIAYLQNRSFHYTGTQTWIGAYIESNSENGVLLSRLPNPNGVSISNGLDRYVLALFWSIQTITSIGYGTFSPVTVFEWWTGSLLQLVAGIAWAYFIGSFVDIAAGFNAENRKFEQRCDYANNLISNFEPESECVLNSVVSHSTNIGGDEVAKRIRAYIHKQYRQSKRSTYECTINDRYPILDSLSPDLRKIASVLLLKSKLEEIPYLSSSFLSIEEQSEVVMQCNYLDFSSGEIYDVNGPRRGIFIMIRGIGSLGLKENVAFAGRKLLHENTIAGRGGVLIEDKHPMRKPAVLSFLTYSQVLFIPRAVILAALEKNDRAAWKGSGRWIYARTLLRKRSLKCA